jgi:hypothetical protein
MSSNVVSIDRRALARSVSAEARRRYIAQRSEKEVAAIRRNRFARLRATKRWWISVTAITAGLSASVGAVTVLWIQSNTRPTHQGAILAASVAPVPGTPMVAIAPLVVGNTALATTTSPIAIERSPVALGTVAVASVTPTHTASMSSTATVLATGTERMPIGSPVGQPAPSKQVIFKLPVRAASPAPGIALAASTKPAEKPTTQYEAAATLKLPPAAVLPIPSPSVAQSSAQPYVGIGVPVDGVLQIQVGRDPAVKHVRIGERLPSGDVLRRADSVTGQVETSERSFLVKVH